MNKFLKSFICLLSVISLISCGNPSSDTTNPNTDNEGESHNPTPSAGITETLNLVAPTDESGDITGFIGHSEVSTRFTKALNKQLKKGLTLQKVTGDDTRSELKKFINSENTSEDQGIAYLKLGSSSTSSNALFTFNTNAKILSIKVSARAYYKYGLYNKSWHNDTDCGLTIKGSATDSKDFDLIEAANELPPITTCEYTFKEPVNSFELMSKDVPNGRAIIETIAITYTTANSSSLDA